MPTKNDLASLKRATEKPSVLPSNESPTLRPVQERQAREQNKRVGGRPAKPKAEKRSYKVVLSLTESEGRALSEKAGLAGDATYLYAKLKELGVIKSPPH